MKNKESKEGCIALLISVPVLMIVSAIANGWALAKLWGWFVVPIFENMPILTIPAAMGISLIVGFLTSEQSGDNDKNNDNVYTLIIAATFRVLFRPAFAVFFGWVILTLFW